MVRRRFEIIILVCYTTGHSVYCIYRISVTLTSDDITAFFNLCILYISSLSCRAITNNSGVSVYYYYYYYYHILKVDYYGNTLEHLLKVMKPCHETNATFRAFIFSFTFSIIFSIIFQSLIILGARG